MIFRNENDKGQALTPYQRLIEGMMHAFIVLVLLAIFLKVLVF
jgi:hypothetical protein